MSAAECPEEHCKMFSSRRGGSGVVAGGGGGEWEAARGGEQGWGFVLKGWQKVNCRIPLAFSAP